MLTPRGSVRGPGRLRPLGSSRHCTKTPVALDPVPFRFLAANLLGQGVVQLLLRITAVPGHTDELLQALRSVMRSVQVDGACSDAHLLADLDDRNALWYWEDWTALDAFERHMRSERFARLLSIIETSSTLPLLECRMVAETRGLEYLAAVRGVQLRDDGATAAG